MTDRERQLLVTLTHKVRLLSLDQAARTWWPQTDSGRTRAHDALRGLAAQGWLIERRVNAHPELALTEPVFAWLVGEPQPNFDVLAHRLQSRWTEPPQPVAIFFATRQAANHFAGFGGKLRRPLQVTHDLHVSTVYLQMLAADPELADAWVCEELLTTERRHQKLPDAILKNADGSDAVAIEFGGLYDAVRVRKVHGDCVTRGLPYELW